MDKQKLISEMAKEMLEYGMEKYPTEASVLVEEKLREQFYNVLLMYADYLINAGYRKIHEDNVVLTIDEIDEVINRSYDFGVETGKEKGRKETAEKFERLANERIAKEHGKRYGYEASMIDDKSSYDGDIVSLALFEICKEFTGETK